MLGDVALDGVQERHHARLAGPLLAQVVQVGRDHAQRRLAGHSACPLTRLLAEPAQIAHQRANVLVEFSGAPLQLSPFLARQASDLLGAERAPASHRDAHETRRRLLDGKPPLARRPLHLIADVLAAALHLGQRVLAAALELLALKRTRDVVLGEAQKFVEIGAQRPTTARRQAKRLRPLGLDEVVNVDDVVRHGAASGDPLEVVEHRALTAGAGRAGEEQVVAGGADLQAEVDRLQSSHLADRAAQRGNVRGGLEGQRVRVQAAARPSSVQPQPIGHTGHDEELPMTWSR